MLAARRELPDADCSRGGGGVNFANHNVHGPDISFYQDAAGTPQMVNFNTMKAAGASYVIIKAGQRTYPDPDFVHNWKEAKAAGMPRGSYWFYDSREDPKKQAQKYWSLLQDDPGELIHAADWEENYNGSFRNWQYFYDFLFWFQDYSKFPHDRIPVYTNYFYWLEHAPTNVLSLQWFKRHPLWIASYGAQTGVKIPPPWTECILWQYGTPSVGIQYGAESLEIDMNVWNGDLESFKKYFGLSGEVIPPPAEPPTEPGAIMSRYTITTPSAGARLRPNHDTNNTAHGTIPGGTVLASDEDFVANVAQAYQYVGDRWAKVSYAFNSITYVGWVAVTHLGGAVCTLVDNGATEHEPAEYVADFDVTLTAPDGKRYAGTVAGLTLRAVE
jgi:lysozyme